MQREEKTNKMDIDDDILDGMLNIICLYKRLKKNGKDDSKLDQSMNWYNAKVFLKIKELDPEQ